MTSSSSCDDILRHANNIIAASNATLLNLSSLMEVSILLVSVLIPASQLLNQNDVPRNCSSSSSSTSNSSNSNKENDEDNEANQSYFIGMQCPSHPLSRKIQNEVYYGPTATTTASLHNDNALTTPRYIQKSSTPSRRCRPRCSIAVMGCIMASTVALDASENDSKHGQAAQTTAVKHHVTTATSMMDSFARNTNRLSRQHGQICILDGEDTTRESFSVPTCQYGRPHPVSLVIDKDNRVTRDGIG